jgi:hypothetical protein
VNNETSAQKSSRLLRFMENRKLLGFEKSFKMSKQTLLSNRFLLGISKQQVPKNSLFVICEGLGMQECHLDLLMDNLPAADVVHFGFEENQNGCIYKVYLEYCVNYNRGKITKPTLIHMAFKWNSSNDESGTIANYTYYPKLSTASIVDRLTAIYSSATDKSSFKIAQDIINAATAYVEADDLMYMEVSEEGNLRLSFDINVYEANIRLSDIKVYLFRMRQHFSISEREFEPWYSKIKDSQFGHLSGGIDRDGNDFFTVYYEPVP